MRKCPLFKLFEAISKIANISCQRFHGRVMFLFTRLLFFGFISSISNIPVFPVFLVFYIKAQGHIHDSLQYATEQALHEC